METVAIICIAVVVVLICVILAVLIYHQMLLINEINKRLLLLSQESMDKERTTYESLQDALQEIDRLTNEQSEKDSNESDEPFNPHTYHDEDLDLQ